jgi:cytochrome b561
MTNQSTSFTDTIVYNRTAITLHWITAGLVILQFALAEFWGFTPHAARHLMIIMHMSFGLLLAFILLLRLVWLFSFPHSDRYRTGSLAKLAPRVVHALLYVLLVSQVILGIILRWVDNQALSFFGLQIPSPFGVFSKTTGDFVDEIHDVTAWVIIILAAGHAAFAVFHHFILRDAVLRRMLPFLRSPTEPPKWLEKFK